MSNKIIYKIFIDAIRAVHPRKLLPQYIRVTGNLISIAGKSIERNSFEKLILISCGKASSAMAAEAETILGDLITDGICVTKHGHSLPLKQIETIEAGHPYPDENSIRAGQLVKEKLCFLSEKDIVILLLTGGASSLLADVPDGCTLEEIKEMNKLLVNSGASINEINIVRKHVSNLKGGQLSKSSYPASVFAFILSDVPGDKLEDIGSGITTADPSTFKNAIDVLLKYSLFDKTPPSIIKHLHKGKTGLIEDTPKAGDKIFSKTSNTIIGSNHIALIAAAASATKAGFFVNQIPELMEGDVEQAAKQVADALIQYEGQLPCCFLWGGETTVTVSGKGAGGRNQHLALCVLKEMKAKWNRKESFTVLCAGTDGTDGPTDAAGAIINSEMLAKNEITTELIESFITAFNSNAFFKEYGTLLLTGPTQTNVMDIVIALVS